MAREVQVWARNREHHSDELENIMDCVQLPRVYRQMHRDKYAESDNKKSYLKGLAKIAEQVILNRKAPVKPEVDDDFPSERPDGVSCCYVCRDLLTPDQARIMYPQNAHFYPTHFLDERVVDLNKVVACLDPDVRSLVMSAKVSSVTAWPAEVVLGGVRLERAQLRLGIIHGQELRDYERTEYKPKVVFLTKHSGPQI